MLYPLSYGGSGAGTTLPAWRVARETGERRGGFEARRGAPGTSTTDWYRCGAAPSPPIPWAGDSRAALRRRRRRPARLCSTTAREPARRACPPRWSSSARGSREHGDYATNVALQLAKQAGRPPRDLAGARWPSGCEGPRGSRPSRSPGPGFLNITVEAGAQGAVAAEIVAAGRGVRRHATAGRAADQPGVRLGQPHRPDPPGRHPLGGGRRRARPGLRGERAPRSPGSTTSTTTAPRSTGSAGRCWRARAASRLPRTATAATYIDEIAAAGARRAARRRSTCRTSERAGGRSATVGVYDDVRGDQAATCTTSASTSTSTSTSRPARRRGAVDRAIDRLTEMGNIYEKDGALWMRTEQVRRRQGPGGRQVRRPAGAYFSGDAAYYLDKRERGFDRCVYHARRRPPRLRRPADGACARRSATTRARTSRC